MAKARPNVNTLPYPQAPRPAAEPTQGFGRVSGGPSNLAPIADFGSLSNAVVGALAQLEQDNREADIERGKTAAKNADRNARDYASAVSKGAIPEDASPWFRVGFQVEQARTFARFYEDRINEEVEKQAEANAAVDPETGIPHPPESVQSIRARVYEEMIGKAGHLTENVYSSRALNEMVGQADERAFSRAHDLYSANLRKHTRDLAGANLVTYLDTLYESSSSREIGPKELSDLTGYIEENIYKKSIKDPSELVMGAVAVNAEHIANRDGAEAALHYLDSMRQLKVGNQPLDTDISHRDTIERLTKTLRSDAEQDDSKDARNIAKRRAVVSNAVLQRYGKELADAYRTSATAGEQAYSRIATAISSADGGAGEFGVDTAGALEDLLEMRRGYSQGTPRDPQAAIAVFDMIRQGKLDEAELALAAGAKSGALDAGDYQRFGAAIDATRQTSRYVDNFSPFVNVQNRLSDLASRIRTGSEDGNAKLQKANRESLAAFRDEYTAIVQSAINQPNTENILATELPKLESRYADVFQKRLEETTVPREELISTIYSKITGLKDAKADIEQGVQKGLLSKEEGIKLLESSARAQDPSEFIGGREFAKAEQQIEDYFSHSTSPEIQKLQELDDPSVLQDRIAELKGQLMDKATTWFQSEAPKIAPEARSILFRRFLQDSVKEIVAPLRGAAGAAKQGLPVPATPEEAQAQAKRIAAVKGRLDFAEGLDAVTRTGKVDVKLTVGSEPVFPSNPLVTDEEHGDIVKAMLFLTGPEKTDYTLREDNVALVQAALDGDEMEVSRLAADLDYREQMVWSKILDNRDISTEEKVSAYFDMKRITGIHYTELLNGRTAKRDGISDMPITDKQEVNWALTPLFYTKAELDLFFKEAESDPKKLTALLNRVGIPMSDSADLTTDPLVAKFYQSQMKAIRRIHAK